MWMRVQLAHLVFSTATLSFPMKNHAVVFVSATTAKKNLFHNHRNRKVVGGTHNVLAHYVDISAPNLFDVVLCNPFKWDILWSIILIKNHVLGMSNNCETNFIP
jgi:hypothetical protein